MFLGAIIQILRRLHAPLHVPLVVEGTYLRAVDMRWMLVGTLALGVLSSAPARALQITDDRGVTVTLTAPAQRIVSLLPSLTESVCALGQCARLVGVDRYSRFPASLQRLPQLGGGIDPHIEAVVALKPDLVLVAKSSRAAERLQALGLNVVALEPKTYADVQRVILQLGVLLGVSDAATVWRDLDTGVSAVAEFLPASVRVMRVYFEVGDGPYAASESSFMGETLTRLGVSNIVPGTLGPFPKLNPEFIVRANPDLIMIGPRGADSLATRPGWSGLRALQHQRICVFTQDQADALVRPGPRMVEGARLMAQCLVRKTATLAAGTGSVRAKP